MVLRSREKEKLLGWGILFAVFILNCAYGWAGKPLRPLVKPPIGDIFSLIDLGVGGDQHYPESAKRYFTNIADVDVGDMDGDGIDDIVLLANAIPYNGAYSNPPRPAYKQFNFCPHVYSVSPPYGLPDDFLNPGDYLYGKGDTLAGFNPVNSTINWFKVRPITAHFAPPSSNVVAGMVDGYIGSDVAWLRNDGRGHFELMFVTPFASDGITPAPARVRMGFKIRLATLAGTNRKDIVIASGGDIGYGGVWDTGGTTTLEPFSGQSRLFWLENKGWNAGQTNLEFVDHSIAEVLFDKMKEAIVYGVTHTFWGDPNYVMLDAGGHELAAASIPAPSLNVKDFVLQDIDGDNRQDVLISNHSFPGTNRDSTLYYNNDPPMATLNATFSDDLRRPAVGDRWVGCPFPVGVGGWWQSPPIIWYKDMNSFGAPNLNTETSTSTYRYAVNPDGTQFSGKYSAMIAVQLTGGEQAFFFQLHEGGGSPSRLYRRLRPFTSQLILKFAEEIATNYSGFYAADFDGDGNDEIATIGPYNTDFYSVRANGSDGLTVSKILSVSHAGDNWAVADRANTLMSDVDGDGKKDVVILAGSDGGNNLEYYNPALTLLNTTPAGGPISFSKKFQKGGALLDDHKWASPNAYSMWTSEGGRWGGTFATGDFNKDGFPDFVRRGNNSNLCIFLNKYSSLPKMRVSAKVSQGSGNARSEKTWSAVYSGHLIGGDGKVYVSTAPVGGFAPAPNKTLLSE